MKKFQIRKINYEIAKELSEVGFDETYVKRGSEKFEYKNLKIYNITLPQANILKQTAISVGADCGVHRETITGKIDYTDCILGGSISQLRKISAKLKKQPFSLKDLAENILQELDFKLVPINLKGVNFDFSKSYIVGILNITSNSFSDGGNYYEYDDTIKQLHKLIDDGADIIELGAESTKPFSKEICAKDQLEKLVPILNYISKENIKIPISIDTRSSEVANECINLGADIINDVSGFDFDENMINIIAQKNVPIIIQHTQGTPETMQINPHYENIIDDLYKNLEFKINMAISKGIKSENIIADVGIGFGKTREQNLELIKRADEFTSLRCPIMYGISRKSFLNMNNELNEIKDIYTLAINSSLIDKKINFIRVHNVKLHKKLIELKLGLL